MSEAEEESGAVADAGYRLELDRFLQGDPRETVRRHPTLRTATERALYDCLVALAKTPTSVTSADLAQFARDCAGAVRPRKLPERLLHAALRVVAVTGANEKALELRRFALRILKLRHAPVRVQRNWTEDAERGLRGVPAEGLA